VFWIYVEIWIARIQQHIEMVYEGSLIKTALREYRLKNDRTLLIFQGRISRGILDYFMKNSLWV
jgi:hypothetical protein